MIVSLNIKLNLIKKNFVIILLVLHFTINFDRIKKNNKSVLSSNNNTIEFYFSKFLCKLLVMNNEKSCKNELINNYNFFYEVKYIRRNINFSVDIKKSLIENIFIVVGTIPFLKYNITINYKINNKG